MRAVIYGAGAIGGAVGGYLALAGNDVIYQIYKKLLDMALPNKLMIEMVGIVGEVDFRISEGANDKIQLDTLLAHFAKAGSDNK